MSARHLMAWFLLLLSNALPVQAGDEWSTVAYPLTGPPEVMGSYAAGCIAGAIPLPLTGAGYQVMRPSRNRYYGHPLLIQFVERWGQQATAGGGRLLIGDLGQPRGGPMPNGHRSHQSGLDVDIWFLQPPQGPALSRAETEQIEMPSMIRATEGALNLARWSPRYRDALKLAAQTPGVERIFVNAIIKQALCESETDRRWLEKVRPWWGHDAHFHVRLACPPGSYQCTPQKPLPLGDGCDADLRHWVQELVLAARSPRPSLKPEPPSADRLPTVCHTVLYRPTASKAR